MKPRPPAVRTRAEPRQKKAVLQRSSKIPDPTVKINSNVLPLVIKEKRAKRGMGGSAELEEGMGIAEARRVLQEKLVEARGVCEKWSHYFYYVFIAHAGV